jgi:hypothetical protein
MLRRGREEVVAQGALDVIDCDGDHAKGIAFNMLFLVWRYRTTAAAYRRAIVAALALCRRYPEGIGICQFLDAEGLPPDAEARAAFVDMLRVVGIRHLSLTYEGSGFRGAAIRGVVLGAQALGRPRFDTSVHVSLTAAARWHAKHQAELGRPETAVQIERMSRELRQIQRERHPKLPSSSNGR